MRKLSLLIAIGALFVGLSANAQSKMEKTPTQEDLQYMEAGDKIVSDVLVKGQPLWHVEKKDGTTANYWGNPDYGFVWEKGQSPTVNPNSPPPSSQIEVVCGTRYCCMGISIDNGHWVKCVPPGGIRWPNAQ